MMMAVSFHTALPLLGRLRTRSTLMVTRLMEERRISLKATELFSTEATLPSRTNSASWGLVVSRTALVWEKAWIMALAMTDSIPTSVERLGNRGMASTG